MIKPLQHLLVSASILTSIGAIASAPAFAFNGTTSGPNIYYESNGTNTYQAGTNVGSVTLTGDKNAPGNNLELGGPTDNVYSSSTLQGLIGGHNIILSGMSESDWFGEALDKSYGATNFANQWFNAALAAYNFSGLATNLKTTLFSTFVTGGGFQRASDPNISYVNLVDNQIKIGLAGHFDLRNIIVASINAQPDSFVKSTLLGLMNQLPGSIQASEVVKITYGGETGYYSSFVATGSGQVEKGDGVSHNGNYEITLAALPPVTTPTASVPEPSLMLGLLGVGGLMSLQRKKQLNQKSM